MNLKTSKAAGRAGQNRMWHLRTRWRSSFERLAANYSFSCEIFGLRPTYSAFPKRALRGSARKIFAAEWRREPGNLDGLSPTRKGFFTMRIGFALPNIGPVATPEAVSKVAERAEDLGYDSLWT